MEKENKQPMSDQLFNEYMAEYNTLRSEIVRRIEIRNSIVFGVLTFAGVLLSFGLEIPTLAIIYIIISMFLAAAWVQSDVMVSNIGCYIREKIEPDTQGLNWETYRQQARMEDAQRRSIQPSVVFSTSGIFFITQTIALVIAFSNVRSFSLLDWALSIVAVFCELLTIYFFIFASRENIKNEPSA
jgi:hypothetical protein